ncbi:MAG: glycoside hydrolase family 13 [Oscillochloris sp.]|nr:glycoside hydrolase family 13 [Oscillochloris sp.]
MILQLLLNNQDVAVLFRLPTQIWADSVHLVGDFNRWNTSATPMRRGEQYWEARLTLHAGKRYFYAYLIDGVDWCTDSNDNKHANHSSTSPVTIVPVEIPQARRKVATYL